MIAEPGRHPGADERERSKAPDRQRFEDPSGPTGLDVFRPLSTKNAPARVDSGGRDRFRSPCRESRHQGTGLGGLSVPGSGGNGGRPSTLTFSGSRRAGFMGDERGDTGAGVAAGTDAVLAFACLTPGSLHHRVEAGFLGKGIGVTAYDSAAGFLDGGAAVAARLATAVVGRFAATGVRPAPLEVAAVREETVEGGVIAPTFGLVSAVG